MQLATARVTVTSNPNIIAMGPGRLVLYAPGGTFFVGGDQYLTEINGFRMEAGIEHTFDLLLGDFLWIMVEPGAPDSDINYLLTALPYGNNWFPVLTSAARNGTTVTDAYDGGCFSSIIFHIHMSGNTSFDLQMYTIDAANAYTKLYCQWTRIWENGISGTDVLAICDPVGEQADYSAEIYLKKVRIPATFQLHIVPADGSDYTCSITALATT